MGNNQSSRKPKGGSNLPTPKTTPSEESGHSDMDPTLHTPSPLTTAEDSYTPRQEDIATPTADPLSHDSDFDLLRKFIEDNANSNDVIDTEPLLKVLASSARVLSKFPSNQEAVVMVTGRVLPKCASSLPSDPPSSLMEVQMNALEAFSQLDIKTTPSLIEPAINLISTLWCRYPSTLPAACNIKQLAHVLNASLQQEILGVQRSEEAIQYGQTFVTSLMLVLSDSQLVALEMEGVFKSLRGLLRFYEEMSADTLRQIVVGVGMFTEIKPSPQAFLDEELYSSLVFAAQKYPTQAVLQQLIWRLFTLLCLRERSFAVAIAEMEVIPAAVNILKQEGSHLVPILRFITACCQVADSIYIPKCLNQDDLMQHLLSFIKSDPQSPNLDDITTTCDLLAFLCNKAPSTCLSKLLELKLVLHLGQSASHWPEACILPTYLAIEGVIKCLVTEQTSNPDTAKTMIDDFYDQEQHLFLMNALANPVVYSNPALLDFIYLTLQKLLKLITPDALAKMCSQEFLELYVVSFVRDTLIFPDRANRIVFVSHYFIFQIKEKEAIQLLKDSNFHTPVVDLIKTSSFDVMCTAMGLLSCLIGKYFEFLKDVKPFLEAKVPDLLLDKARKYGRTPRSQFGDDFSRILLNLTAEKELSMQLYNNGFLEQLLPASNENYVPVVKKCMVHAIGNIALAGQSVKEVLYERKVYRNLLDTLNKEADHGDSSLLSACCRVLHILASGDAAKRLFVENNCVDILLKIMRTRKDNPEICWRPLGLLSSLGFMAVLNRRFILTKDVMEAVVKILKEDKHGKVLSYTMLVFLAYLQMDEGTVNLRQLAIGDRIREVTANADYQKQASDLERWGQHVLEKQDLYTFTIPRDCSLSVPACRLEDTHISDWPPSPDMPTDETRLLLPLDVSYLQPQTPLAIELTTAAKVQLVHLGLDPDEPLFRIGRVYGSTHGWCSNCDKEGTAYEMVIRAQSMTPMQYQHLIDNGWYRRGGVKMFRMMHNHSLQCCDWETRVRVKDFDHKTHKSYRKVLRRMPTDRLTIETKPRHFSREAFDLYNTYHIQRHEKPQKSEFSYCEHVVDSPIANQTVVGVEYGTFHQLYRLDGKLVAIGIIDIVPKGIVSIYMWYDVSKEISKYSFGVFSALKEIEFVLEMSKSNPTVQYYYLQGWNSGNQKLSYKANYQPEEFYCPGVVSDWVESTEKVTAAIERVTADRSVTEGTPRQENMDTTGGQANNIGESTSVASSDPKESEKKDQTDGAPSEKDSSHDQSCDQKEASKDKKTTTISCEAIDNDHVRHNKHTGASLDISKIVVCLNYSQYMYLGDVFEKFQIGTHQRELMEKRYTELYLALCPELTNQMVIDLKACRKDGVIQVSESGGVASATPTNESMQTDTGLLVM